MQRSEELDQFLPAPAPAKTKKHNNQLTQPRTKDYAVKAQRARGTLQSQNQNRFVDEIDEEYVSHMPVRGEHKMKDKNNYHSRSPVALREIGHSQQTVPTR